MEHLKFTEDGLTRLYRNIGPRPDFLDKNNLKDRVKMIKSELERFSAALRTDFEQAGTEVDDHTLTVKPAPEGRLGITSALVLRVTRGKNSFSLTFNFIHGSNLFRADASVTRANLAGTPLLRVSANNGPSFRSEFTKLFTQLDQNGFNSKKA